MQGEIRLQRGTSPSSAGGIQVTGQRLCLFLDPHRVLDSAEGPRWPLIILAFDESKALTTTPQGALWSLFSTLHYSLWGIVNFPIFSLFLSRGGNFHLPTPETPSYPSNRTISCDFPLLDPIPEISFDDLAFPMTEYTVTLDRVIQLDWMSHLGRPLYVHSAYVLEK